MIPSGAIVKVVTGDSLADTRMIDVLWHSRTVAVFADDVYSRGVAVTAKAARSASASA